MVPSERTKVILLTAPKIPVTFNRGFVMNSWFDQSIDADGMFVFKEADAWKSNKRVTDEIHAAAKELHDDYSKVFLGGFSQGCAMALMASLTSEHLLGGVCGLSGFLFPFVKFDESKRKLPIFLYHGLSDDMVYYQHTMQGYKRLFDASMNIEMKTEPNLQHNISPDEEDHIRRFFGRLMP